MIFFSNAKTGHPGGYFKHLLFHPFSGVGRLQVSIRFFLVGAPSSLKPVSTGAAT